ncbi:hypothetical protein [Bacillus sp. ISL-47]|nr:hypothetical protein [Bacillus sp. ISL-47]
MQNQRPAGESSARGDPAVHRRRGGSQTAIGSLDCPGVEANKQV